MKTKLLVCVVAIVLTGCSKYETLETSYATEQDAAVAFLKDNKETLKSLKSDQEMLGWVVKYKEQYYNTTPYIGGVRNVIRAEEVSKPLGGVVVANIHTHPVGELGQTSDFFSAADLSSSKMWNMYLLSLENCNVRLARNTQYRSGVLLGRILDCNK